MNSSHEEQGGVPPQSSGRRRLGMPGRPRPGEYLENAWVDGETWIEPGPLSPDPDLPSPDPDPVRPDPVPTPGPRPVPEPGPRPTPEPFPQPAPEPDPIPAPVPAPTPEPAPGPSPVPDPVPAPPVPPLQPHPPLPDPEPLPVPDPGPLTPGPLTALAVVELKPALEAILMVVTEPTTSTHLAQVLGRPKRTVDRALRELAAEYTDQGRGFELRFVAGGWRYYSRVSCAPAVERFVLDGQHARLTQAALETLAVIAYRQPVSRSRVSAVRGVNCDGVMRTLVQRGLVEETGSEPETGAILYRTTNTFLERMGLRGLDELPELAPFLPEADDVEADSQEGSAVAEAVVMSR
jgi:segregation and condensation protein B